jgi:hypothetical protein
VERRAVHLTDRGRGERLALDGLEELVEPLLAILGLEHLYNPLPGHRRR